MCDGHEKSLLILTVRLKLKRNFYNISGAFICNKCSDIGSYTSNNAETYYICLHVITPKPPCIHYVCTYMKPNNVMEHPNPNSVPTSKVDLHPYSSFSLYRQIEKLSQRCTFLFYRSLTRFIDVWIFRIANQYILYVTLVIANVRLSKHIQYS